MFRDGRQRQFCPSRTGAAGSLSGRRRIMGLFIRLVIALLVIGAAYVLMVPRVPALRGWHEANACPYLDRISEGLCRRTLRSNEPIQVSGAAVNSGSLIEVPQRVTERLDRLSAEL